MGRVWCWELVTPVLFLKWDAAAPLNNVLSQTPSHFLPMELLFVLTLNAYFLEPNVIQQTLNKILELIKPFKIMLLDSEKAFKVNKKSFKILEIVAGRSI